MPADYTQLVKLLADAGATLDSLESNDQMLEVVMKRRFEEVKDSNRAEAVAFLQKFVSTLNTTAIAGDTQAFYVDNPYADKRQAWPGRWRLVGVEAQPLVPTQGGQTYGIIETLARGYVTALTTKASPSTEVDPTKWDGIALVAQREDAHSNTVSEEGIVASATKLQDLLVTIPFVSPQHEEAIVAQLRNTNTYTNPKIQGQTFTGAYKLVVCGSKKMQDGSVTLTLRLVDTKFVLHGYSGWQELESDDVIRVWGVPRDEAQAIGELWKTSAGTGASVTFDTSSDSHLVSITLAKRTRTSGSGGSVLKDDCSETVSSVTLMEQTSIGALPAAPWPARTHYTVESVRTQSGNYRVTTTTRVSKPQDLKYTYSVDIDREAKVEQHLQALPTELANFLAGTFPRVTNGVVFNSTDPDVLRGKRREITVTINPDCTLDLRGTELAPRTTGESIVKDIGESATSLHSLGLYWNYTKAQVETLLDTLVSQEVGKTKEVRIQRNDLGYFDAQVSIHTITSSTASLATTGDGIQMSVSAGIQVAATSLPAVTSGKRERVNIDVAPDKDGLSGYKVTKQTVVETELEKTITGTAGIKTKVQLIENADDASFIDLAAGVRKRHSISLRPGDDGTLSGAATEVEVVKTELEKTITGAAGIKTKVQLIENADDASFIDLASGKRKRHSISLRPGDDGTISGSATEVEIVEGAYAELTHAQESGKPGVKNRYYAFNNLDNIPTISEKSGPGVTVSPQYRHEDDGTVSGAVQVEELPETELTAPVSGTKYKVVGETIHGSDRDDPGATPTVAKGETYVFRGDIQKDGSINWSRVKVTDSAFGGAFVGASVQADFTLVVTSTHYYNVDLPDGIATVATYTAGDTSIRREEYSNIQMRDTGQCDYVKTVSTLALATGISGTPLPLVNEKDNQYKDDIIKTSLVTIPYLVPAGGGEYYYNLAAWVHIVGKRSRRSVTRTISRTFSTTRPSSLTLTAVGSDDGNHERKEVGELDVAGFRLFFVDTEFVVVPVWTDIVDDETEEIIYWHRYEDTSFTPWEPA